MSIKKFVPLTILMVVAFFILGIFTGYSLKPDALKVSGVFHQESANATTSSPADFSIFWQAWRLVETKFANRQQINPQKMVYGAIKGMLASLDDPYTMFFTPEENKEFSQDLSGHFEGIGAELTIKNNFVTVVAPLDNTPAKRSGLKPNDRIIKVDDRSIENMTLDKVVRLIRGPKGKAVKLTIIRDGLSSPKEITIVRDTIKIPTTRFETKYYHNNKIAYIKIYSFNQQLETDFIKIAHRIRNEHYNRIILDLRNNPGGYLNEAVAVSSWFLKPHSLVVTEDYGPGKKKVKHYSYRVSDSLINYPVVVLVNGGSASASEILAGALKDNRQIKLIGEKTFGKGCIQEMIPLRKGSVKITIANWLTPSGICISKKGIEPNVKVKFDEKSKKDNQLQAALREVVKIH